MSHNEYKQWNGMIIMRIGLALAGGGASGGAHVGVIRALTEAGIHLDCISGTSSGAMVAGLFACGISTSDLLRLLPSLGRHHLDIDMHVLSRLLHKQYTGGLIRGNRLQEFIEERIGNRDIKDVLLPLAIVSTDLQTGREIVFSSTSCPAPQVRLFADDQGFPLWTSVESVPLATAIRASISIPFVFQPVHIGPMILADGGLVDNCPVEPLRALGADFVIAVDTITPFLRLQGSLPLRVRTILQQVVNIGLARHAALAALRADIFLAPPVGPIGALDFARLTTVAELGYQYTQKRLPAILEKLSELSTRPQ